MVVIMSARQAAPAAINHHRYTARKPRALFLKRWRRSSNDRITIDPRRQWHNSPAVRNILVEELLWGGLVMRLKDNELAKKYTKRRNRVLRTAVKQTEGKVDGLMITHPVDVRYLCGIMEGCPALLIGKNWSVLFTSTMFKDVAAVQAPGIDVTIFKKLDKEIAAAFKSHGTKRIGIQTDHMTMRRYQTLRKTIAEKKLIPVPGVVTPSRAIKDEEEIAMTQRAIRIAEKAMRQLLSGGASYFIGKTERQLATELEYLMRSYGADRQAFQSVGTIVGAGPNSASCHHLPSNRKVRKGDSVLFDWGAELNGYRSDMTRVVFVDSVPKKIGEIYPIVRDAMREAMATLKPGVACCKVDAAARDLIKAAGYGKEFRHSLGHGVGLLIHEPPMLARKSKDRLKKNMIVTIEPGIYFSGIGGVRLEDDLLITLDGCKNLCRMTTTLEKWVLT